MAGTDIKTGRKITERNAEPLHPQVHYRWSQDTKGTTEDRIFILSITGL
jgi:hypothetical protein